MLPREDIMKQLSRPKTIMILTFLVVVWGINWPLSKFALDFAPPVLFAGIRTFLGGVILLCFALPRWKQLRFKQNWHVYSISAFLNIIIFYGLQTVGLDYMPAGIFSTIVFFEPVLLGIFSWIWLGESMYSLKVFGLILGFLGVATISIGGFTGDLSVIGILLALVSAIGWGLGTTYVKKTSDRVEAIWMVTLQLLMGGLLLIGIGSGVENWSSIRWEFAFISNLLFISTFVIAFGWLAYFILVGAGEASKVGSYTFLIPLLSVFFSSFILNEAITINLLIGLLLIVTSICLVNMKFKVDKIRTNVS